VFFKLTAIGSLVLQVHGTRIALQYRLKKILVMQQPPDFLLV